MNRSILILLSLALSFLVVIIEPTSVRAQSLGAELPAASNYEAETLTRGPLHEAFAEQVNYDAQPGITIRQPPPEPIDEIPPAVRPDGNNVEWIPGYWAWDDDREDFLWVSGVWRDVPPDRQWVPGYWAPVDEGFQWIAGFWNLNSASEVEYLPYPPQSLERGPTSPLPSASHYWVSGCWQYQSQRYLWQPGFWSSYRADWVWTPAHYIWTPRGAIYIRGYWDYPLARRGILFAPVYFPHDVNYPPRYQYSPSVVIDLSHVLYHLFVQPGHHHYYWGDYYGDRYRRSGYQANFAFHGRGGYDPLFNYYNTQQRRQGVDYSARLRAWHVSQELHQDRRPQRTWNQQQALFARVGNNSHSSHQLLAQPLRAVIEHSPSDVKFRQIDSAQRQALGRRSAELRELSQHRNSNEANSRMTARPSTDFASQLDVGRAPTTRSAEHRTPDRSERSERNSRTPQLERSEVFNRARTRIDGDRGLHTSPPVLARPEPASQQPVAPPNRSPQNRTQRTPERSTIAPSVQPKPQRELPKAANQQHHARPSTAPSPLPLSRPSFSSRRTDDNSSGTQSVPRVQPKPGVSRQSSDRLRQDSASTPRFVPHARSAEPGPNKTPSFRAPQHQARPEASSAGRPNVPSARTSSHSHRSAPTPREEDHNGRSKR